MKKRLLAILLIAMALLTACGYIVVEDPETITLGSLFMPTGFAEEEALPSYEGDAETETEEKLSLKAGSRGDEVKALQKMLREYGFLNGKDDGIYGKKTGEAVKQAKEYLKDEADRKAEKERRALEDKIENAAQTVMDYLSALQVTEDTESTGASGGNAESINGIRMTNISAEKRNAPQKESVTVDSVANEEFISYLENEFQVFRSEISRGARGKDVKRLQTRLNDMHYLFGGVDGQFGANTQSAIRYFQRLNGLKETGVADEETQRKLFSGDCKKSDYPMYKYRVEISISKQRVYVYEWNYGAYDKLVKTMICTTGAVETPTPLGTFKMGGPCGRWYYFKKYDCWAQYAYRIKGGILFHSVLYSEKDESTLRQGSVNALGSRASHGCVRLKVEDAKWLYNNVPAGTTCRVYN